jgi:hypothetical protein
MIKVDRDLIAEPAVLSARYRGKTEQERAIAKFLKHIEEGQDPLEFKFNFTAYTKKPLKRALTVLFHGKCAYCESRYAGSQPMDVEHWRPKGKVDAPSGEYPGYYWLAASWANLLPSCIDCNRSRTQYDSYLKTELNLGKETQFPVLDDDYLVKRDRPHSYDEDGTGGSEVPLLVNPCLDDPSLYFHYRDGLVLPKPELTGDELAKAENSIIVYALNRSALVYDRLAVVRLIDQRIFTLECLMKIDSSATSPTVKLILDELIAHEVDCLVEMKKPAKVFSAMVTQLLSEHGQRLGIEERMG